MKNKIAGQLSIALCAALVVGGIGVTAYAGNSNRKETTSETNHDIEQLVEDIADITVRSNAGEEQADITKDETVYVMAGTDGSVQKIIVSDWIKNAVGSDSIIDTAQLTDVENVKGGESYTMNGDNMRVWDAQGNSIYCRGSIEKELPVALSVSYRLDGKAVSASELAGKSGKVTIRYDYTNNQYETVEIDGKQEKIYVPFVMLTGLLLDNDTFDNVEVTNGRLINDGSHTAVVGIAFPGLSKNLDIKDEKLEIPEYIEISADVKNFSISNTVTVAVNDIFSRIDAGKLDAADDLTASLEELTDAVQQLTDGSSALYDGLCTLLSKSEELVKGIDRLADGALQIKNGAGSLDSGALQLSGGAKELAEGLGTLAANNDTLNAGARQVFESLLGMADSQLAAAGLSVPKLTIENYGDVLNAVSASLNGDSVAKQAQEAAYAAVCQKVNEQRDAIKAGVSQKVQEEITKMVTEAVRSDIESQVLASMGMTQESYEAGIADGTITQEQQNQITAAIDAQMGSEAVLSAVNENVNAQMQSEDIQTMIASKTEEQVSFLIDQNMNSDQVKAQINAALEAANSGVSSILALKSQLDSYNQFYAGLSQYTAGVASAKGGADQLNAGAAQLKSGTAELCAGANELYNGILTMQNGAPALVDGVTLLRDGAMQLSDGLKEFDEKGVQKLMDVVEGDLDSLFTRVKATFDVSRDYKSFSGLSDDMDGKVKFIYRTDAVEE